MVRSDRVLSILSAAAATVSPALAQTPPTTAAGTGGAPQERASGDIVVTASRTGQTSLQSTPLAVSVFGGEQLSQSGTTNIADLARLAPSLKVGEVTASPSVYIRGIGTNNVFNGSDPNVATILDGVYLARAFQQYSDFFDVDRVEVLRGPQGTTFGRNAVGGVVNIISKRPGEEFDGRAKLSVGNYDMIRGEAFLSGPLISRKLFASIAGNYENRKPFFDNIVPGERGVGDADRGGFRAQLRWTPADWIDATTRLDYTKSTSNFQSYDHLLDFYPPLPFFALANSIVGNHRKVALDYPGRLESKGVGISEDINFEFSDVLSLRSITAYRDSRYSLSLDADASEAQAVEIFQSERAKQFSQEFNLVLNLGPFDGIFGLYYIRERNKTFNTAAIYPPFEGVLNQITPDLKANSKAVFAQGSYEIAGGFSLTLGGRYTKDTKRFLQNFSASDFSDPPNVGAQLPGFPFIYPAAGDPRRRSWDDFTIKVGADWQATEDVLAYLTYSEGFKSGGFNYAGSSAAGISFDPETLNAYEAGLKTQWLDRRVRLNLTGFYYDYSDLQVQQSLGPGNIQITNAATARVRGVEAELSAKVTPRFTLTANATYLNAKYRRFPTASVPDGLVDYVEDDPRFTPGAPDSEDSGTFDASGNRLNNSPKFSYSISGSYVQPIGAAEAYVNADYFHQSSADFDASNARILREPGYGLVNLAIGFNTADRLWNFQLLSRNLFDKEYFVVRAANGLVPSAPSGAPRTVIFSVLRNF